MKISYSAELMQNNAEVNIKIIHVWRKCVSNELSQAQKVVWFLSYCLHRRLTQAFSHNFRFYLQNKFFNNKYKKLYNHKHSNLNLTERIVPIVSWSKCITGTL